MSEAELVYQYGENANAIWSLLQWWVSVSFGVLALAHFTGKHINLAFLLGIASLYSVFSLILFLFVGTIVQIQAGVLSSLTQLGASEGISDTGSAVLAAAGTWERTGTVPMILLYLGVSLATVCYPIYVWIQQRRSAS